MNFKSLEECDSQQIELVESLKGLLSIPSVKGLSQPGAPFGIETVNALHYMLETGSNMGFKTCNLDGYAGFIEFGEGDKEIAVLCHLDVVPAGEGWDFDPFTPFIDNGRLFGRGTNDDKGPAISALFAMKSLKDSGYNPPCRIRLILGLDEESGSQCMVHYKETQALPDFGFTPDAKFPVIFAEKGILHITIHGSLDIPFPTTNSFIFVSAKGGERANMVPATCLLTWIENSDNRIITESDNINKKSVTVKGVPGHASMPEFGENAISKAMLQIGSIMSANDAIHPFVSFYNNNFGTTTDGSLLGIDYNDNDSGSLTCNVGLLDMTTDSVTMTLDIRYPVTANPDMIVSHINKHCASTKFSIIDIQNNPPLFVDKDSDLIQTLLSVYNEATSGEATPIAIGGGTYARSMPNIVAFGPNFTKEDDVAHQAGEYIKLDDLFLCRDIYQKAIQMLAELAVN